MFTVWSGAADSDEQREIAGAGRPSGTSSTIQAMSQRISAKQPLIAARTRLKMELLTQNQVAIELAVSLSTVVRLRRDRKLRWHRVRGQVRISRDAVRGYIESVAVQAAEAAE